MNNYTMNPTVIILGIILILLVYILYTYFTSTTTTLTTSADLNVAIPPITKIASPTNTRYAYSVWVYINNFTSDRDHTIFAVTGKGGGSPYSLRLYLDTNKPILYCDVGMSSNTIQSIVTSNFPIQKWVYVTISVDNQFIDFYLDGKLIKSTKALDAQGGYPNVGNITPYIYFGTFDAYIAKLVRYTAPLDPQTVWYNYLAGNGSSSFANYGLKLEVLKNNSLINTIPLIG